MTTKEVIEWFAAHHKELQYGEYGHIKNVVFEKKEGDILNCPFNIDDIRFERIKSLSIKEKQYKPYEKVETWMLGKELKHKKYIYQKLLIKYIGDGVVKSDDDLVYHLDYVFENFTYKDGTPFGEEVI